MFMVAASIVAAGASFTCAPTRVRDGDGPIWCAEGKPNGGGAAPSVNTIGGRAQPSSARQPQTESH